MPIFDFLRGEFIDVIHWTDDTRDTIVWRFEREGHAIKYGAKLTVREGQAAVFVHEGQLADTFGPGLYELETNNMPILTTLQHWDHGFQSPFKSRDLLRQHPPLHRPEVGDAEPDHLPRPGLRHGAAARLRHLHHAGRRPGEVHDRDRRHRRRVHHRARSSSRSATSSSPTSARSSPPRASRCSTWRRTPSSSPRSCTSGSRRWSPSTASTLPAFMIENISLPAEVEAALDKRTATGVAGDLSRYTEFSAAEALTTSAANPGGGGGMAAGLGMGAGMAMAERMAPQRPLGRRARAAGRPDPAAAARRRSAGTSRSTGRRPAPTAATSSGGMVVGRQGHRRQLALDAGRAGLAARPRRRRARRPLQRAAAAARRPEERRDGARPGRRGAAIELRSSTASPARPAARTCASTRTPTGSKCPHCGHEEAIPAPRGPIPELDLRAVGEGQRCRRPRCRRRASRAARTAARRSSSALDEHARECPFCASPIVTDTGPSAGRSSRRRSCRSC